LAFTKEMIQDTKVQVEAMRSVKNFLTFLIGLMYKNLGKLFELFWGKKKNNMSCFGRILNVFGCNVFRMCIESVFFLPRINFSSHRFLFLKLKSREQN
jgi:hypothetical protein